LLDDEVTIDSGSDTEEDEVNIESLSSDHSDVDEDEDEVNIEGLSSDQSDVDDDEDGATKRISLTQVNGCIMFIQKNLSY